LYTYQIIPFAPPAVISTMITFRGSVNLPAALHQRRSCSFVTPLPTLTQPFASSTNSILVNSVSAGSASGKLTVLYWVVASCRSTVEMIMPPLACPKTGAQECPESISKEISQFLTGVRTIAAHSHSEVVLVGVFDDFDNALHGARHTDEGRNGVNGHAPILEPNVFVDLDVNVVS